MSPAHDAANQAAAPTPEQAGERRSTTQDRRILDRGETGRRLGDQPFTRNALPPLDEGAAIPDPAASYLAIVACTLVVLWLGVIAANLVLNPLIYGTSGHARVARMFESGHDYAVFDVNFDIRALRRAHVAQMTRTPDLVVIGASHWQEAHAELVPNQLVYNAHVHRDYFEDILASAELFVSNNRLPKTFLISVRDLTFLPVQDRTDERWLSYVPEYRQMARRLGLPTHPWWRTLRWRKWVDLLSLRAAWEGGWQMLLADERPGPTNAAILDRLDIVRRSGSVLWSRQHVEMFTEERALREAAQDAAFWRGQTIAVDPYAVEALDRLLGFLGEHGVRVVLAHPPFHPAYSAAVRGTAYMEGLDRITEVVARLAAKHRLDVVGSFDATSVGCDAGMFIDSNHSNAACLKRILDRIPAAGAAGAGSLTRSLTGSLTGSPHRTIAGS